MNISELKVNQRGVNLEVKVIEKSEVKEFSKFGNPGKVATAVIEDDSGSVELTLWGEQTALVKKNDKIKITNGYVREWQGKLQINIGKIGKIEVV